MLINAEFNNKFLNISDLKVGEIYERVAFIHNTKSGTSSLNEGFFTFYVKDIKSNLIIGRMFSVDDFIKNGILATKFRRKPVRIWFEVQDFNGDMNMVINQIEDYEGSDFPYSEFVGKVKGGDSSQAVISATLNKAIGKDIGIYGLYKSFSTSRIADGRCGAYLLALEMTIADLTMASRLPDIEFSDIIRTFYVVQNQYYDYLKRLEDFDVETEASKINVLLKTAKKLDSVENYNVNVIIDTLSSLLGLSKPEHLYSHIIVGAFNKAISTINLAYINSGMAMTARKNVGDGLYLIKY